MTFPPLSTKTLSTKTPLRKNLSLFSFFAARSPLKQFSSQLRCFCPNGSVAIIILADDDDFSAIRHNLHILKMHSVELVILGIYFYSGSREAKFLMKIWYMLRFCLKPERTLGIVFKGFEKYTRGMQSTVSRYVQSFGFIKLP